MDDPLAIPDFLKRSAPEHNFTTVEAVKVAYRQTKDGMVVSFAIHPSDMPGPLALAAVGTRMLLAVAEIKDEVPINP